MSISSNRFRSRRAFVWSAVVAATCMNGAVADTAGEPPVPDQSMFTSVRQAFNEDYDHEVVRGHFDVGSPPDARRYYCLVEEKKGRRQPNGVSGQPVPRADGMTGIKANAVSAYSCASAEQKGLLVTAGYVLSGKVAAAPSPQAVAPKPTAPMVGAPAPDVSPPGVDGAGAKDVAAAKDAGARDVAGVKLGMSLDEVRAVLRSKKLLDSYESMGTLGHGDATAASQPAGGRFVNIVAAWTPPVAESAGDWESFEVMFTPVPGKERAMAIIHSVGYAANTAVHESALKEGLVKKYGGFATAAQLPAAPTWAVQAGGVIQAGDACPRRGVMGGLGESFSPASARRNLSLTTTLDEFQSQIDRCGSAILTEDHALGGPAAAQDRTVTRFTVTAYSPSLGLDGAQTASQLLQTSSAIGKGPSMRLETVLPAL